MDWFTQLFIPGVRQLGKEKAGNTKQTTCWTHFQILTVTSAHCKRNRQQRFSETLFSQLSSDLQSSFVLQLVFVFLSTGSFPGPSAVRSSRCDGLGHTEDPTPEAGYWGPEIESYATTSQWYTKMQDTFGKSFVSSKTQCCHLQNGENGHHVTHNRVMCKLKERTRCRKQAPKEMLVA